MKYKIDKKDEELIKKNSWCMTDRGYWHARVKGKLIYMHRLITGAKPGEFVDHINNDRSDNRRTNLRICSKQQNQANTPSKGVSKYKGVCPSKTKGKWLAQISPNRKGIYLGTFDCESDAARAYNVAAKKYYGKFARLNIC